MTEQLKPLPGKKIYPVIVISATMLLMLPLFYMGSLGALDFWYWFSINLIILISLCLLFDRNYAGIMVSDFGSKPVKKIASGIISALILYGIYYGGYLLLQKLFAGTGAWLSGIYGFKRDTYIIKIALLLIFIIGPGEEILWRGYIQRTLGRYSGPTIALVVTSILYALIHIASMNPLLVFAALFGGLFWGMLYIWKKSILINIISHIAWDILIFIVSPFAA